MVSMRTRFLGCCLFALLLLTFSRAGLSMGNCCPFCSQDKIPTLAGDYNQALMVLVGNFTNAKVADGTTDFVIDQVLKPNDFLKGPKVKMVKGKQVITLPRYIPQAKNQFVIFCDVFKDQIDPYRGVEVQAGSDLVDYLKGAAALKDAPLGDRLRYSFKHLNSPEFEVAMDAYREFARTDYKDYMETAKKLPAETLAKWLQDEKTPPYRYGLYASLLGLCGKAEDGKLLRRMIDDPEKRKGSGIDGMLVGYVALQPKEAWKLITDLLKDSNQDFLMRYAGLRTARFLWEQRPDILPKKVLAEGVALLLDHGDMADFAIEDLRKWKRWEMCDRILELFGKKSHDVNVVKRSILRYALQCPQPAARAFVDSQRRRDANWVKDTEELLKLESPVDPPANGK
jgi:hypothetical protein